MKIEILGSSKTRIASIRMGVDHWLAAEAAGPKVDNVRLQRVLTLSKPVQRPRATIQWAVPGV